jgi:hypothetical protein
MINFFITEGLLVLQEEICCIDTSLNGRKFTWLFVVYYTYFNNNNNNNNNKSLKTIKCKFTVTAKRTHIRNNQSAKVTKMKVHIITNL